MRSFVTMTFALALVLAPAAVFAQQSQQQTPPQQQPPASGTQQQTAAPQTPATPKVSFTTPAGILLVQIKPDQTAVFDEMISKLKTGLARTQDATLKQQAAGFKVYKATEPMGANALYVVLMDPALPNSEYELFAMLNSTLTPEEKAAPGLQDTWKRYANAFAAGLSKLSLTPVGGGM
jgi:glucose/arabinose dehydrogenase